MAAHPCSSSSSRQNPPCCPLTSPCCPLTSSELTHRVKFKPILRSVLCVSVCVCVCVCVCVELCVCCCIALEGYILVFWKGCLPVHLKRGPPATRGIDEVPTLLHQLCHASPVHAINCNPFQRSSPSQGKWGGNDSL